MNDVKTAVQSKTVWGAVVVLASQGAQIAGYDIGDPSLYVNDIMSIIGAGFAMYGRISATSRVKVM